MCKFIEVHHTGKSFRSKAILWEKNGLSDFSQVIQQGQKHPKEEWQKNFAFSFLILPLMQMLTYPEFLVITVLESPF